MNRTEAELRHELEDRLRFETLLAEISARFINLPADQVDRVIEDAQRRVCDCLDLDLSALWQWSAASQRFLTVTHLHAPPEGPTRPERIDAEELFPWQYQKMLRGEPLAFSTEEMPPESMRDQESRRHFGIKSSVVLPLSAGGGPLIGVLTFDTLHTERSWPVETVNRLTLVAQIFSNALARKEAERILRESEARLSLAADSAEAGLWELNCDTGLFWATEKARTIFGYDPEEAITTDRFERSVFPDDLESVRQAIARSLTSGDPVGIEYRILAGAGRLKWIYSRGRPYFKANGTPDRLLGVSIDISKRKDTEESLRESETALRSNQKDLQRLAGRLISAQEEELRRLSRELHDDLTQRLAVLAIEAGKLELQLHEMEQPPPDTSFRKVLRIKEQLIRVSEDVHRISRQLHPTILDDLGLIRAIESECAAIQHRENLTIVFREEGVPDRIPIDSALCLYRIVQEGLKNIIRHSGATKCAISLQPLNDMLCLTVQDEGTGFDPDRVRNKPGLGLSSMRERAQLVRGYFALDSRPGQGTVIRVRVPMQLGGA